MNSTSVSKGISERNRRLLTALNRSTHGPFDAKEAASLLSMRIPRTQRFLAYLAASGWLARIRRGLYVTVPLETAEPALWREDPWKVAAKVFSPSFYLGGWTACEHWDLTEQIFRETLVVTTKRPQSKEMEIQGFPYRVKQVTKRKVFGTTSVWRDQTRVQISDPTKTVVDLLDDPSIGGGVRNVADILRNYLHGNHRDDSLLVEYSRRMRNGAIFKRLGYLVELLGVSAPDLVSAAKKELTSGLSSLDPAVSDKGRILRRWNLRVNVALEPQVALG